MTATTTKTCGWRCGDTTENHKHYAVLVRDLDKGKLLGRLSSDGSVTNRNIFAVVLSKARATEIAEEISNSTEFGNLSAKAILF